MLLILPISLESECEIVSSNHIRSPYVALFQFYGVIVHLLGFNIDRVFNLRRHVHAGMQAANLAIYRPSCCIDGACNRDGVGLHSNLEVSLDDLLA